MRGTRRARSEEKIGRRNEDAVSLPDLTPAPPPEETLTAAGVGKMMVAVLKRRLRAELRHVGLKAVLKQRFLDAIQ